MKYLKCFLFTLFVNLVFFVLWVTLTKAGDTISRMYVSFLEIIFVIFAPLGFLIYLWIKKMNERKRLFVWETLFAMFCGALNNFGWYFNWGFSTKYFFSPDFETLLILDYLVFINFCSILALGIVLQIILLIKNKKSGEK